MGVANNDSSNSDDLGIEYVSIHIDDDEKKKVHRIMETLAKNTAGAGTVRSTGAGGIITAGAGSVSISGGTGGGAVNTSGAGSVTTYNGVPATEDDGEEEDDDWANKIPWAIGVLGGLADSAAIGAAVYKSPRGAAAHAGEVAYRVGLLSVLAAGLVEMVAAFWVSRDKNRRRPTGKKILYVSICTLLLAMVLDGVAIVLKK